MSIFSAIRDAIFGGSAAAAEAPMGQSAPSAAGAPAAGKAAAGAPAASARPAMSKVDVEAVLDKMDETSDEDLDWRVSIVDLMKLLKLDSSLKARKLLAQELKYTGDMGDSAKMNVWLHKQVMTKLAENGGIVPADLRD
jgi:CBS-domain-containing membrane protein